MLIDEYCALLVLVPGLIVTFVMEHDAELDCLDLAPVDTFSSLSVLPVNSGRACGRHAGSGASQLGMRYKVLAPAVLGFLVESMSPSGWHGQPAG